MCVAVVLLCALAKPPSTTALPRKSRDSPPVSLVLDLDETLVHASLEYMEEAHLNFTVTFHSQDYQVWHTHEHACTDTHHTNYGNRLQESTGKITRCERTTARTREDTHTANHHLPASSSLPTSPAERQRD